MDQIDILIAVNGAQLAQQVSDGSLSAGSASSPTSLGSYSDSNVYISMTAQASSVVNNGGESELQVRANSGDNIRWSMQTFDCNSDYTAYLYDGSFSPSGYMSALSYMLITTSSYLPPSTTPTASPVQVTNKIYVAQGTVVQPGETIQYTLSFRLINNTTGATVGYFYWDPFIQVSG